MNKESGEDFKFRQYGKIEAITERGTKESKRRQYASKNAQRNRQSQEQNLQFDVPVAEPTKPIATPEQAREAYERSNRFLKEHPDVSKTYDDFLAEVKSEDKMKLK